MANSWENITGFIKQRTSQGLLNAPPIYDAGPTDPCVDALSRTRLMATADPKVSPDIYGPEPAFYRGQPVIKARTPYGQSNFPWNNIYAQEWYVQMLPPGNLQDTITGRRFGTLAVVPTLTQKVPQRGQPYNRTIHGYSLSAAFPSGGDPGS